MSSWEETGYDRRMKNSLNMFLDIGLCDVRGRDSADGDIVVTFCWGCTQGSMTGLARLGWGWVGSKVGGEIR